MIQIEKLSVGDLSTMLFQAAVEAKRKSGAEMSGPIPVQVNRVAEELLAMLVGTAGRGDGETGGQREKPEPGPLPSLEPGLGFKDRGAVRYVHDFVREMLGRAAAEGCIDAFDKLDEVAEMQRAIGSELREADLEIRRLKGALAGAEQRKAFIAEDLKIHSSILGNPGLLKALEAQPHDAALIEVLKTAKGGAQGWQKLQRDGADDARILAHLRQGWREYSCGGSRNRAIGGKEPAAFIDVDPYSDAEPTFKGTKFVTEARRVMVIPLPAAKPKTTAPKPPAKKPSLSKAAKTVAIGGASQHLTGPLAGRDSSAAKRPKPARPKPAPKSAREPVSLPVLDDDDGEDEPAAGRATERRRDGETEGDGLPLATHLTPAELAKIRAQEDPENPGSSTPGGEDPRARTIAMLAPELRGLMNDGTVNADGVYAGARAIDIGLRKPDMAEVTVALGNDGRYRAGHSWKVHEASTGFTGSLPTVKFEGFDSEAAAVRASATLMLNNIQVCAAGEKDPSAKGRFTSAANMVRNFLEIDHFAQADVDWVAKMKACKTADEARDLFGQHEQAVEALQRSIPMLPTCGNVDAGHSVGFSVVPDKEWRRVIGIAKKMDAVKAELLERLVKQGREIHGKLWEKLYAAEGMKGFRAAPEADGAEDFDDAQVQLSTREHLIDLPGVAWLAVARRGNGRWAFSCSAKFGKDPLNLESVGNHKSREEAAGVGADAISAHVRNVKGGSAAVRKQILGKLDELDKKIRAGVPAAAQRPDPPEAFPANGSVAAILQRPTTGEKVELAVKHGALSVGLTGIAHLIDSVKEEAFVAWDTAPIETKGWVDFSKIKPLIPVGLRPGRRVRRQGGIPFKLPGIPSPIAAPPRPEPYTAAELKLESVNFEHACQPYVPEPIGKGKAQKPGKFENVINVKGRPYWCFGHSWGADGGESVMLHALYTLEEWGGRPTHLGRAEGNDEGALGEAAGTQYVVGPPGETIVVTLAKPEKPADEIDLGSFRDVAAVDDLLLIEVGRFKSGQWCYACGAAIGKMKFQRVANEGGPHPSCEAAIAAAADQVEEFAQSVVSTTPAGAGHRKQILALIKKLRDDQKAQARSQPHSDAAVPRDTGKILGTPWDMGGLGKAAAGTG